MSDSLNISLRYGSEKHAKILDALNARKKLSRDKMEQLYTGFERAEDQYLAYLPETEADVTRRSQRENQGKPTYTTIKIPYSYAVMLSAHTFLTSVFLGRSPVLQFTGRHGETQMQVQGVEALMDYQVHVGGLLPVYYLWMHDAPKYGFGVTCTYWANETKQISRIVEDPVTFFGIDTRVTRKKKLSVRVPGYEGNRAFNVKPYDYLPDPRVPLMDPQKGEFTGRRIKLGWNTLVRGKEQGKYFNIDVVQRYGEQKDGLEASWGVEHTNTPIKVSTDELPIGYDIKNVGMNDGYEMVVDLIPRDWHLGQSTQPEKWVFTVIADMIVIEARPFGSLHDEFPYNVLPMEFDAYSLNYRSMLETLKPLNDTLDWLINTHFFNVRAALNNQFVVDPLRVVMKDLTREGAGKIIRLKETAYGTDVRSVLSQLPVADVTQGHLRDTQMIMDLIQRTSGVTDVVMGLMQQGGRKTAAEIRTSSGFGVSRLKTMAEYWSAVAFQPHAQMLVANTQQYYDAERQFKIAGDLMQNASKFMQVNPELIAGAYDFVPVDGTMPIDRYAQANLWREILMGIQRMPQIMQEYDIGGIFSWMAQLAGLKNINQFKVQLAPDEQLQKEMQKGQIVPIGGSSGPRAARDLTRVPDPGQISGMGPTN